MTRCVYSGFEGTNLTHPTASMGMKVPPGRCKNEATRRTDSRALGRPEDALDLCDEHHEIVKAYFLAQAAGPSEHR